VADKVYNWTADPFTRGSYSYATVQTKNAREILKTPVAQTVYFAGEALFEGEQLGTVEAALVSGLEVAKEVVATPSSDTNTGFIGIKEA